MYLQLKSRNVSRGIFRADIRGHGYILVGGKGAFFPEKAVLFKPSQLRDRVVQSAGIFFQVNGIALCVLACSGQIPRGIFIELDNGIVDIAQLAFLVGIVFGQRLRHITGEVIIINRIHDRSHCPASFL